MKKKKGKRIGLVRYWLPLHWTWFARFLKFLLFSVSPLLLLQDWGFISLYRNCLNFWDRVEFYKVKWRVRILKVYILETWGDGVDLSNKRERTKTREQKRPTWQSILLYIVEMKTINTKNECFAWVIVEVCAKPRSEWESVQNILDNTWYSYDLLSKWKGGFLWPGLSCSAQSLR